MADFLGVSFVGKRRFELLGSSESLLRIIVHVLWFNRIVAGVIEKCLILEELMRIQIFFTHVSTIVAIINLLRTLNIVPYFLSQEMVLAFEA